MKILSLFFSVILISSTSWGALAYPKFSVNGSCANLNMQTILESGLKSFEAEAKKALKEKLNIDIVESSGKIKYTGSTRSAGPENSNEPWVEIHGEAQMTLKTSKGTVLKVSFLSKGLANSLHRSMYPDDAWVIKPGFYVGMNNAKSERADNEGNVRGSATSCHIYPRILTAQIDNKATRLPVLVFTWGEWYPGYLYDQD